MSSADPDPGRFRELLLDEEPGFEEVLACVFGIQEHEVRTYTTLLEQPDATAGELAEELDRDRSNVNRSLSTLREKDLVDRRRHLLDSGGHVYRYRPTPVDEARELLHATLEEWTDYVHERIDEFGPQTV